MADSFPQAGPMAWATCTKPVCSYGDARGNGKSRLTRSRSLRPAAALWAAVCCWCAASTQSKISPAFVGTGLVAGNSQLPQFALQRGVVRDLPLQAAGYVDRRRGDEGGELAAQKQHHADNVIGLAESTERHD